MGIDGASFLCFRARNLILGWKFSREFDPIEKVLPNKSIVVTINSREKLVE
jgi:hypothetical protein